MGHAKPQPVGELFETGTEPEFFITDTRLEDAGGGNVRIFCYARRKLNELHLLYTVVVPAESLVAMARKAMHAASDSHNLRIWEADTEH